MRLAHGVGVAVLVAGLGWWSLGHPGYQTGEQRRVRAQAARAAAEPKVYRWRDAGGVLHITDQPPRGRKYEKVTLQEDVNVIPMSAPVPAPPK